MINVYDLKDINSLLSKIDLQLVFKLSIEILFFVIAIKCTRKLVNFIFSKFVKSSDHESSRQLRTIKALLASTINFIFFLFFITNILGDFGIDMKPILATAGVLGVAVGFGGKRFVEDVLQGLVIIWGGQIRVGDYVTVNSSTGTVSNVNLTTVTLRSLNGDVHYIRNGLIDKVTNHTRDYSCPIVDIPISYSSDINRAIEAIKISCAELKSDPAFSSYILSEPEIIAIDEFLDSSLLLRCRFKTTALQQWDVKRRFRIILKQKFDEMNISIPYPQVDVHLNQV